MQMTSTIQKKKGPKGACVSRSTMTMVAAVACAACLNLAAPAGDDRVADRLEQMQAEIERLRQDNRLMRDQIEELRAQTGDKWLTERRAEEVRALVAEVIADADARASLRDDGLMAGWSDGFFLADAHGRFLLAIQGHMQIRWMYNFQDDHTPRPGVAAGFFPPDTDRHRSGFELARTRLTFRGHAFGPDLTYLVRGDFQRQHTLQPGDISPFMPDPHGGFFHLLDAWVRFHLTEEWSIRAGQFKLPFSREQLVSSAHQLAVERSVIDSRLNIGRSQGIDMTWVSGPHRVTAAISDGGTTTIGTAFPVVGGGDGTAMGTGAISPGAEYAVTGRYEHLLAGTWRQFEDFTSDPDDDFGILLGGAVHFQRSEGSDVFGTFSHKWFGFTLDASVEFGGANLFGAFTFHHFDDRLFASPGQHETWGLVLQGGVFLASQWEVFGRYEYGDWNIRRAPSPPPAGAPTFFDHLERGVHLFTVGVNHYISGDHNVKWTTDLGVSLSRVSHAWGWNPAGATGWRAASGGSPSQVVFRTQLQLMF